MRYRPTAISSISMTMYRYVGGANSEPDSLRPRRLATVMTTIISEAQRHAPLAVEAERRLDRQHATGDGHGDGEDVVGEQRGAGHE